MRDAPEALVQRYANDRACVPATAMEATLSSARATNDIDEGMFTICGPASCTVRSMRRIAHVSHVTACWIFLVLCTE
jgi:hypothetical protein